LAIRLGPQPHREGVAATALFAEELGPLCSPELLRRTALNQPEQLADLPLLATETRTTAWQEWKQAAGHGGLDLPELQCFEHTFYMLEAAAGGLGVGIAQRALVESDLKQSRLVAPFGFLPSGRSAYLLYPERLAKNPGVARFRAWLLEEVARRN
ncbi:MAG: LysR substrate-binding domain-containing protein, partial [Rhodospirillales bacterium]|nr:LysR substrate-binding domain-containing protein [Rhodospirillales bacterium]